MKTLIRNVRVSGLPAKNPVLIRKTPFMINALGTLDLSVFFQALNLANVVPHTSTLIMCASFGLNTGSPERRDGTNEKIVHLFNFQCMTSQNTPHSR